jgi:light-regulated signal transduction histidine kinase (bacteriophytochrome)
MSGLIEDLLEFSRVGRKAMRLQSVEMDLLVRTLVRELEPGVWTGRGEVVVGTLPPAQGDPNLLRQVWINLLSNAAKFSREEELPLVEIEGWTEGGEVVYQVKDNGVGFDMAFAGKLFGVFERLHRQDEFEGTGVGLALVSRIVERHGGRIWGEGTVGQGATFWFSLPTEKEEGA